MEFFIDYFINHFLYLLIVCLITSNLLLNFLTSNYYPNQKIYILHIFIMNKEGIYNTKYSDSKHQFVQFNLTQQQSLFLNNFLPLGYSLQLPSGLVRRQSKIPEKIKSKVLQEKPRSIIKIQNKSRNIFKRSKLSRNIQKNVIKKEENKINILTRAIDYDNNQCNRILQILKKQNCAKPFLKAVDALEEGVPDYYEIIKDPVDLSKIQKRIKNKQYLNNTEFHDDIKKMFQNSYQFNHKSSQVYKLTIQLQKIYNKSLKVESEVKYKQKQDLLELQKKVLEVNIRNELFVQNKKNTKEVEFTKQQIMKIKERICKLQRYDMKLVCQMLSQGMGQNNEIQIDLTKIDKKKMIGLSRFLNLKQRLFKHKNNEYPCFDD